MALAVERCRRRPFRWPSARSNAARRTPVSARCSAIAISPPGRFASAEAAYRDSLSLVAAQPQVILKLALVQIAQGKNDEAKLLLAEAQAVCSTRPTPAWRWRLPATRSRAVAVLEPAARAVGADSRTRQNLALAYAFSGDWEQARTVAAQDVPADQLDGRIQQWMALAKPARASDQVAAFIGIQPAAGDPGQPIRLALNKEEAVRQAAAQPVEAPVAVEPTSVATVELPPATVAEPVAVAVAEPVPAPVPEPVATPEPLPVAARQPSLRRSRSPRLRPSARPVRRFRRPLSACPNRSPTLRRASLSKAACRQEPCGRPARRLSRRATASQLAWSKVAGKYWLAEALYAGHRPLRQRQGHRLSPVGQGLRQRPAKQGCLCEFAEARRAAPASSAPPRATRRSSSLRAKS